MADTALVGRTGLQVGSPGQELAGTAARGKQRRHEAGMQAQQLQVQQQMSREQLMFQREKMAQDIVESQKDRTFQTMLQERSQQFENMMRERVYKRGDEIFARDRQLIEEENERRRVDDQNKRAHEDSMTMMGIKLMLELQRQGQADPVKRVKLEQRKQEMIDMYDQQRSVVDGLISSAQTAIQNSALGRGEFGLENWDKREKGMPVGPGDVVGMEDTKTGRPVLHPGQESSQFVWNQIDGIAKRMTGGKVSLDNLLSLGPEKIQQGLVDGSITVADLQTARAVADQALLALQTQAPAYGRTDLDEAASQAALLAQNRLRKFLDMIELMRSDSKNPQTARLLNEAMNVYENRGVGAQLKELTETFGDGPGGVDMAIGAVGTALKQYMQENMPEFVGPDAEYLRSNYNTMMEQMVQALDGSSGQTTPDGVVPGNTPSMLTPGQLRRETQGTDTPNYSFKTMGGKVQEAMRGQRQFQGQVQDDQRRSMETERLRKAAQKLGSR